MKRVIETCDKLLRDFGEDVPEGFKWNWKSATREDFINLVQCIKRMAQVMPVLPEEID